MKYQIIFGPTPRQIPPHSVISQNYLRGHRSTLTITSPYITHNYLFVPVFSLWIYIQTILSTLQLDCPRIATALGLTILAGGLWTVFSYQIVTQRLKEFLPGPNPLIFNPLTIKLWQKKAKKIFSVS